MPRRGHAGNDSEWRQNAPAAFLQAMNHAAFALAATLPALVLIPLNFDSIHGYYAYGIPVAGSVVGTYSIVYDTVDEDGYYIEPQYHLNRTRVTEHVGTVMGHSFMIANVEPLGDGTIRVNFADKNYTIFSHDGSTYRVAPPFSHSEVIGVNQTFVALCSNYRSERNSDHDSTGLMIYQYRGIETHKFTEVEQLVPATEYGKDGATVMRLHGDSAHAVRTITLSPPKEVQVHKFLAMSVHTDGKMRCDYPQVIEHTVDSLRVDTANFRTTLREWAEQQYAYFEWEDPARLKASNDVLYEWYR